jgi:hypothetical protein
MRGLERTLCWLWLGLAAGFGSPCARQAQPAPEPGKVPYRVPRVEGPVKVDGVLDDAAWKKALVLDVNTEVEPGENIPAPVRTQVLLAYGQGNLYVAFKADDPDPSKIRARYTDRDKMYDDDWVAVVLDTFDDARRSFDFFCNPLGVQGDQIETSGSGGGSEWDAIWESAGRITPEGYTVEMAIPFSSLRFQKEKGNQVWGFDAVRSYPRGVRHHIGAFPRDRGNNCYLCQAVKIEGFEGADPGKNLELDPTLSMTYAEYRPDFPYGPMVKKDSSVEPGLTFRWSPTPNLALNATVNPDFSQVEADAAQLDINTRFALYYPEKRPFFLEGMDYFQTQVPVVYTRTLADPAWGAKLTGKAGRGTWAYFTVQDRTTNLLFPGSQGSETGALAQHSLGSVLRYRLDMGKSSTLGVIATDRSGPGYSNRVLGIDTALRFTDADTLYLNAYGSRTKYPDAAASSYGQPEGEFGGYAVDLMYAHQTRDWEYYVHYQDFGEKFRADLGFVPQVGFTFLDSGVLNAWYNNDPDHWFNRIKTWVGYELTRDQNRNRLREVYGTFVEYHGPMESWIYSLLYLGRQSYAGKPFDHNTLTLNGGLQLGKDLTFELDTFYGDDVDLAGVRQATRFRLAPSFLLFGGRHVRLSFDHAYERLWVKEGRLYAANLSELRAVYQVSARTFIRAILQRADYAFEERLYPYTVEPRFKHLLSQLLYSYKINPQTALYVGYSDQLLGDARAGLTRTDRAAFMKIGYAWVR